MILQPWTQEFMKEFMKQETSSSTAWGLFVAIFSKSHCKRHLYVAVSGPDARLSYRDRFSTRPTMYAASHRLSSALLLPIKRFLSPRQTSGYSIFRRFHWFCLFIFFAFCFLYLLTNCSCVATRAYIFLWFNINIFWYIPYTHHILEFLQDLIWFEYSMGMQVKF